MKGSLLIISCPAYESESQWSIFYDIVNRAADRLCPIVPMKFKSTNEGWFTKEVIEAITEKNLLFKILKANNSEETGLYLEHRESIRENSC